MKRRTTTRRRGFSLLTSLIFISLFAVVGASLLGLASTSSRVTLRRKQSAQALNLAEEFQIPVTIVSDLLLSELIYAPP